MSNHNRRDLDDYFMRQALEEAKKSFAEEEVPVGAVLVLNEKIIATGRNLTESLKKATAHAELRCLEAAASVLDNWRLSDSTLYVTLEPCCMCYGVALLSRVKRIVYGAPDHRHGVLGSWVNLNDSKHPIHQIEIFGGVLAEESSVLLKSFFKKVREKNRS